MAVTMGVFLLDAIGESWWMPDHLLASACQQVDAACVCPFCVKLQLLMLCVTCLQAESEGRLQKSSGQSSGPSPDGHARLSHIFRSSISLVRDVNVKRVSSKASFTSDSCKAGPNS